MPKPRNDYAPEVKAAVMAALLEGQGVTEVADKYDIPKGTVAGWKSKAKEALGADDIPNDKKQLIGELLLEYMREGLTTIREQQRFFRDADWLKKQGAAELATLHGVTADKLVRLLEAMSPPDAGAA